MKKQTNQIAAIIILGLMTSVFAQADEFKQEAVIRIVDAITVKEAKQMDFGTIEKPARDTKVHLTLKNSLGDQNEAKHLDTSTLSAGAYKIFGSEKNSISIAARDGASVPGLRFLELNASYDSSIEQNIMEEPLTAQNAPGADGKELRMGGVLLVSPSVATGTLYPDFTLEVSYE